jgi:ferrous iron transport protein B
MELNIARPAVVERARQVALAGNPNCGKTTLFNALTGLRQKVGNYPGVTVEKKAGKLHGSHGEPMEVLDLPGTYSLHGRSPDEAIACEVLLGERADTPRPDVVVVVLDAANLERNLYLLAQIVELRTPMVVALNMVDVAEARGMRVDPRRLEQALGVPVIATVASEKTGLVELKQALSKAALSTPSNVAPMPGPIERAVDEISPVLASLFPERRAAARAEALMLLAQPDGSPRLGNVASLKTIVTAAQKRVREAGLDPVSDPVEARYAWVQEIVEGCARGAGGHSVTMSDRLDAVLTHKVWGWVAFLAVLGLMFFCIFTVAQYPMDWINSFVDWAGGHVAAMIPPGELQSLVKDGIIAGAGSVLVFLPQILILFFFIGLLEDTGYMARAAFIMDRLMSRVGLHGKSFIPLLSSFACAIPGIMATRTIENRKDRLATIFIAPFMSCPARLPVYALLIALFFPPDQVSAGQKAALMVAMYMVGLGAAFGTAWLFKRTLLKGETPMLLLELPPYHAPKLRSVAVQMWHRSRIFVWRVGTVILALSIVIWALARYPRPADPNASAGVALSQSFAGQLGHGMEPAIRPLGFDWKIGIGLVTSFAAREVFVGTMAIVHNVGDNSGGDDDKNMGMIRNALRGDRWPDGRPVFTPLVCVGLMVFYVLAMQCLSTVAVVRRETNGWFWPLFQFAYMTGLAYVASFIIYQGGRLLGWA